MKLSLMSILTSLALGCGSVETKPAPTPAEPTPVAPAPEPLPRIAGDEQVPEKFKTPFGEWLRAENGAGSYQKVVEVSEISNAVTIVLERKTEEGGVCRVGPSTLELYEESTGLKTSLRDFGQDCCPGTTCERDPDGWNLAYIKAVAANDLTTLATFVSAKKKLTYTLTTPDGKTKRVVGPKDFGARKPPNLPGCGFIDTAPSCEPATAKGFTCSCTGGGTNATFEWVKDGDKFVIVKIDESSS